MLLEFLSQRNCLAGIHKLVVKLVVRRDWYFGKTGVDNGSNEGHLVFAEGHKCKNQTKQPCTAFHFRKYPSRLFDHESPTWNRIMDLPSKSL
jgi:hypothetical protein